VTVNVFENLCIIFLALEVFLKEFCNKRNYYKLSDNNLSFYVLKIIWQTFFCGFDILSIVMVRLDLLSEEF
jgi:hypothetical protein